MPALLPLLLWMPLARRCVQVPCSYFVKEQDGDLKFMLAFKHPAVSCRMEVASGEVLCHSPAAVHVHLSSDLPPSPS